LALEMTGLHDFVVDGGPTRQATNGFCRAGAGNRQPAKRLSSNDRRDQWEGSPEIANQDDSGQSGNERQEHDRKTRSYEATTGNPYHLSKTVRILGGALAVVVVITLTALFFSRAIHW